MTTSPDGSVVSRPLRLWPGVTLVAAQWLIRFGLPVVLPDSEMYAILGGLLFGLLVYLLFGLIAFFGDVDMSQTAFLALVPASIAFLFGLVQEYFYGTAA